jgi:hypothetical protein
MALFLWYDLDQRKDPWVIRGSFIFISTRRTIGIRIFLDNPHII